MITKNFFLVAALVILTLVSFTWALRSQVLCQCRTPEARLRCVEFCRYYKSKCAEFIFEDGFCLGWTGKCYGTYLIVCQDGRSTRWGDPNGIICSDCRQAK